MTDRQTWSTLLTSTTQKREKERGGGLKEEHALAWIEFERVVD